VSDLPMVESLDELVALVERHPRLYIRWSRGPHVDAGRNSRDDLTGAELPGLCANPLAVEEWWGDRSLRLWVARRVYDYHHLRQQRGPGVRAWVLEGTEVGRGPDNEPLIDCHTPVAWVADDVVGEARAVVDAAPADEWGPLRRS
jgi:hypothetical protein